MSLAVSHARMLACSSRQESFRSGQSVLVNGQYEAWGDPWENPCLTLLRSRAHSHWPMRVLAHAWCLMNATGRYHICRGCCDLDMWPCL